MTPTTLRAKTYHFPSDLISSSHMDVDQELMKIVAYALTEGQGVFTEDEFIAAYQQVYSDKVAGTFAELLLEGQLALCINDKGEVQYTGVGFGKAKASDAEIASAVEAFISSLRRAEDP